MPHCHILQSREAQFFIAMRSILPSPGPELAARDHTAAQHICGLSIQDSLDATLPHGFHKGSVVGLSLIRIFDCKFAHGVVEHLAGAYIARNLGRIS